MGNDEFLGPDSFGGRDENFNCLPDGWSFCPYRKREKVNTILGIVIACNCASVNYDKSKDDPKELFGNCDSERDSKYFDCPVYKLTLEGKFKSESKKDLGDCPFREYMHNDLLYGDNAGSYKCKSPIGECEPGEFGGTGDFGDCKCCSNYSSCRFFPKSIYSGVGGKK